MAKKYKEYDDLWADCIKLRAGYKSELSGREGRQIGGESVLHAHHLSGKSSHELRFSLDSGICLTSGEHRFVAHVEGRKEKFNNNVKLIRGDDAFEKLKPLANEKSKGLKYYKEYLLEKKKELQARLEASKAW